MGKVAQLSTENSLQREAFEIYYHLRDRRSLKQVAEEIERTERTVAGWSRSFNWVDRVKQREIEDARNMGGNALNAQTTDVRAKYRVIINNFMEELSRRVIKGEIKIRNIQDFERLVKLDLLLMGEATDNTSSSNTTELSKADQDRLDVIAKLLGGKK